jgi:hypothetical protein
MPRPKNLVSIAQLGLDSDLLARFEDFRQGYYGAEEKRLIAEALEAFMKDRYDREPEVKRRADDARQKRSSAKRST